MRPLTGPGIVRREPAPDKTNVFSKNSAAHRADSYPFALQLGNHFQGSDVPVENKERFIGNGPERDQLIAIHPFDHSRLDETDINLEGRVREPLKILQRALGRKDLQFHPVSSQYLLISLNIPLEDASFRAARDDNGVRWGRMKEPEDDKDHDQAGEDNGNEGHGAAEPENFHKRDLDSGA
jgi:hypothetical protein